MANTTYTYANVVPNGGYATSNITLTGSNGTGLTYSTATGAGNWATTAATSWYAKQPKVKITEDDIEINGLSLHKTLQALQERLAIMQVNPALESEFEELRACAEEYRRLEKKFDEQKRMWDTLKNADK